MKKSNILFSLLIFLLLCFSINGAAKPPNWYVKLKQIKLLQSSKQDVERIFENPKITQSFEDFGINFVFYQTSEGEFTAQYSTGVCAEKDPDTESNTVETYKTENNIILNVIYFPEKALNFCEFDVDESKIDKQPRGHDPALHYINHKQGIDYITQFQEVIEIKLFVPMKFDYLKCSNCVSNTSP